jgi:hypothetical protein
LGNLSFLGITTEHWCNVVSELKCCKLCGAFLTCETKGECCPECQYFDEVDNLCLAPEALKKSKKAKESETGPEPEEVDPETFLFEDDEEEEEEEEDISSDNDDDDDDFDDDDFGMDEDWD